MTVAPVSPRQLRKLHALCNEAGLRDRTERLAYLERVVCHPVPSSAQLNTIEAGWCIDDLERASRAETNLLGRPWPGLEAAR